MLLAYVSLVWQNGCDVTVSMISDRVSFGANFAFEISTWCVFQTSLLALWNFILWSGRDVTFQALKAVFPKIFFFVVWRCVFGWCYPTFRYIHVTLCSYLMSWRTNWLFEHWRWRHYNPLKHEGLLTERNCLISRKTWNSSNHFSDNLWYYGRLLFLSRFSPPLTDMYAHAGNISNYLAYSFAVTASVV